MAVNDDLFEAVVRHAHYVERWKTHEVNQMVGFLNDEVFPRTTELIQDRLNSLSPMDARKAAQLQRLNLALREQFRTDYGPSRNEVRKNVLDFAEYEAEWIKGTIQKATPISVDLASPSTEALRAILSPNAIEGDVLGKSWQKWWGAFENNTSTRIMQQIRLGVAEGRSTPEIVRTLVGTRANNYTDGIYQASRREASMIVRTATNDASARAREMTYKQNDDVISGVEYVATLDGRTTIRCASLDGRIFRIGDGPRPPQHPNCRSTTVPVTKSWKELGIPLKDTNATTRASMNGQVSAKMSYSEWLKKQPTDIQNRVLGKSRARLFRKGEVRLDRFQDNGKTLTLDELKRMDNLDQKRVFPGEKTGVSTPSPSRTSTRSTTPAPKVADPPSTASRPPRKKAAPVKKMTRLDRKIENNRKKLNEVEAKLATDPRNEDLLIKRRRYAVRLEEALKEKSTLPTGTVTSTTTSTRTSAKLRTGRQVREDIEKKLNETSSASSVGASNVTGDVVDTLRKIEDDIANVEFRYSNGKMNTMVYMDRIGELQDAKRMLLRRAGKSTSQSALGTTRLPVGSKESIRAVHDELMRDVTPYRKLGIKTGSATSASVRAKAEEAQDFLRRVTDSSSTGGKNLRVKVVSERGRAFARYNDRSVHVDPTKGTRTYVHEIAHLLEDNSPGWRAKVAKFFRKRTKGDTLRTMRELTGNRAYRDTEVGYRDEFINPYMGKVKQDVAREVVSMGTELLYADPIGFMKKDPEMFEFIIDLLRGV